MLMTRSAHMVSPFATGLLTVILAGQTRADGLFEKAEGFIPEQRLSQELSEIEDPGELGRLIRAIEAASPSTGVYGVNLRNLFRIMGDQAAPWFIPVLQRQVKRIRERFSGAFEAGMVAIRRIELKGQTPQRRAKHFARSYEKAASVLEKAECARALAQERAEGIKFLRELYERCRGGEMACGVQQRTQLAAALVLAEAPESPEIVEEFMESSNPLLWTLLNEMTEVDARAIYWTVKLKSLPVPEKTCLLLRSMRPRLSASIRDYHLALGAYYCLRDLGNEAVPQIVRVAKATTEPLVIRRKCIDLLYEIGAEESIKRLTEDIAAKNEMTDLREYLQTKRRTYEESKRVEKNRFNFGQFMKAPSFGPLTE